ncbi:MAG: cation-transporting P-type ATPase, partial [Mycobacterium sp.]|nr:cation-transporting P-type ATPase [Mycobacterium sp.]
MNLVSLVRDTASLPARAVRDGVRAAGAGAKFVTAPLRAAPGMSQAVEAITEVARDLVGDRVARRYSRNGDRYWIEVRGLAGADAGDALGPAVMDAVCNHPGVLTAALNVPLSRVVVEITSDT